MARATLAAALVVVVLLAGCGGAATRGGDGTPTRTVTPAPLPPEAGTPRGPAVLAPGVSEEGVFDAGRLARAHAAVLSDTSFTAVREERRRYANGSLRSAYRSVIRMSADGERFRYQLNQTDLRDGTVTDRTLARYADGSVVYVADDVDGETTYSVLAGSEGPVDPATVFPERATARSGIGRLFATLPFEVVDRRAVDRRTVDGRRVHRLVVENGTQDLPPLRDIRMNATVREDGLVTAYRLTYHVGDVRVSVAVDFRRVGETEVTPPDWLPAARNATGVGTGTSTPGTDPGTPTPGTPVGTSTRTVGGSASLAVAVSPPPRPPRGPGASGAVSSPSSSAGART